MNYLYKLTNTPVVSNVVTADNKPGGYGGMDIMPFLAYLLAILATIVTIVATCTVFKQYCKLNPKSDKKKNTAIAIAISIVLIIIYFILAYSIVSNR